MEKFIYKFSVNECWSRDYQSFDEMCRDIKTIIDMFPGFNFPIEIFNMRYER